MLLLSKAEIKKVFSMKDGIEAVKEAFSIFTEGKSITPLRTCIDVPKYEGNILFMPGYVEVADSAGLKIICGYPKNIEKGKATSLSTMLLIDSSTGEVCAILDGTYLTQLRTGAASGAATDLLARKDAKVGALIGTGGQAAAQLEAMITARDLDEVLIYDMNIERAKSFVNIMLGELSSFKTNFTAVKSSDEAVSNADIISTATPSHHPVFNGALVKKGAHVNAIGSYTPVMQELDPILLQRADKIFFDSIDAVLSESGDVLIPLEKGLITKDKFSGELGQIILGKLNGRETEDEITVFKTVGISTQDILTAQKIYNRAVKENIGMRWQ